MIAGRTLLDRVAEIARQAAAAAGEAAMVVATDHDAIADHARALGHEAVMTSPDIASGSGRAYAAALGQTRRPDIVINLQGDAPFIPPSAVVALIRALRESEAAAATPVVRLGWAELDRVRANKLVTPFSGTTCVRAPDGRALWFSKAVIPAIRGEEALRASEPASPVLGHLGLYGYRFEALARFEAMPPSFYERIEGLEQLRFLEAGMNMIALEVALPRHAMSGIDTAEDVKRAEEEIAERGDPHGLWS